MSSEIAKLVQLSRKGDTSAFREIVNTFQQMVYSIALRMLNDVGRAEDIVQETFLQAWSKMSDFNANKASFSTWLFTIANRKCIDQLRLAHRDQHLSRINWETLNGNLDTVDKDELFNTQQCIEIIKQLSISLSPLQKSVFVLKDLEGMDTEEVQQITGLNAGQIKDNLYLARKNLRKKFKSQIKLQNHAR